VPAGLRGAKGSLLLTRSSRVRSGEFYFGVAVSGVSREASHLGYAKHCKCCGHYDHATPNKRHGHAKDCSNWPSNGGPDRAERIRAKSVVCGNTGKHAARDLLLYGSAPVDLEHLHPDPGKQRGARDEGDANRDR